MTLYGDGLFGDGTFGGTSAIAGSVAATSTVSGSLRKTAAIRPTTNIAATSTVAGSVKKRFKVAGAIAATSSVSGIITAGAHQLQPAHINAVSTVGGSLVPIASRLAHTLIEPVSNEYLESFAQRVYDALLPITNFDAKVNWHLNYYIGALGHMFQEIEDYARDSSEGDPGWSPLMDINRIPTKGLDWISQFVGVTLDYDDTDDGLRQQVRGHDRWGRGTPLSITSKASRFVPPGGQLYMSERNPDEYHIFFIFIDAAGTGQKYEDVWETYINYQKIRLSYATYTALYNDTPGDWTRVQQLLLENKPAGIQTSFIFTTNILYLAIYILEPNYQEVYIDWLTYQSLYDDPFPNISLDIPLFRQLVSARYYRNVYNQFQLYSNLLESYQMY